MTQFRVSPIDSLTNRERIRCNNVTAVRWMLDVAQNDTACNSLSFQRLALKRRLITLRPSITNRMVRSRAAHAAGFQPSTKNMTRGTRIR